MNRIEAHRYLVRIFSKAAHCLPQAGAVHMQVNVLSLQ